MCVTFLQAFNDYCKVTDTRLFYKNTLYKNIEAENDTKIKNILIICSGSTLLPRFENLWNPIYNLSTDIPVYLHCV